MVAQYLGRSLPLFAPSRNLWQWYVAYKMADYKWSVFDDLSNIKGSFQVTVCFCFEWVLLCKFAAGLLQISYHGRAEIKLHVSSVFFLIA